MANSINDGTAPPLISTTRSAPRAFTKQASWVTEIVAGTEEVLIPYLISACFCAAVTTKGVLVLAVVVAVVDGVVDVVVVTVVWVVVGGTTGATVVGGEVGDTTTVVSAGPANVRYSPKPISNTNTIITANIPVDDLFIPICRLKLATITKTCSN